MINYINQIKNWSKRITNYKKLKLATLAISLLAINGCSTNYSEYKNICSNLPKPYKNKLLEDKYNKEKGVYIETNDNSEWMYLSFIQENDRWDFVELNLKQNLTLGFPRKDGLYKIYRDYGFNNCIEYQSFDNRHKDTKGDFCLAYKNIEKVKANIKLERNVRDLNSNTSLIELKIIFKDLLFLKTNAVIFSSDTGGYGCKGEYYEYIFKDFK